METNSKPAIIKALALIAAKEKISALYAEIDRITNEMVATHEAVRYDYDLAEVGPALMDFQGSAEERRELFALLENMSLKGAFFKVEITDNLAELQKNGRVFKSASFTAFSVAHRSLKNKPASLKAEEK